jgi:hypothetical protein
MATEERVWLDCSNPWLHDSVSGITHRISAPCMVDQLEEPFVLERTLCFPTVRDGPHSKLCPVCFPRENCVLRWPHVQVMFITPAASYQVHITNDSIILNKRADPCSTDPSDAPQKIPAEFKRVVLACELTKKNWPLQWNRKYKLRCTQKEAYTRLHHHIQHWGTWPRPIAAACLKTFSRCCVCLSEDESLGSISHCQYGCGQAFHTKCIYPLHHCPTCRTVLLTPPPHLKS